MRRRMGTRTGGNIAGQMVRYGVSGAALAGLYAASYWTLAVPLGVPPLVAHTLAFSVSLIAGWIVHSRWSFRDRQAGPRPRAAYGRFLTVNLAGYALNGGWVWLLTDLFRLDPSWPLLPNLLITPWLMFLVNRRWTFAD